MCSFRWCFLLAALALTPSRALAEGRSIARIDAIRMGAQRGPGVAVAAAPRSASIEASLSSQGFFPRPPSVTMSAGRRAGSFGSGLDYSVTVLQDMSVRGLGGARSDAALSLRRAVDADVQRMRLEAATRAGLAWVTALEAEEFLRLRKEALAQAERIVAAARARVGSGVGQPYELAAAQGDYGAAVAAGLDAEGNLVEALAELRFALALPAADAIDPAGDLYATDEQPLDEAKAIQAAETGHPLVSSAQSRVAVAQQEVRLTHAVLAPGVSVGGVFSREGDGTTIVLGMVGFPLPLLDPTAFESARQRAVVHVAEALVDRARAEVDRDIRLALHERHHMREVREALRVHALPAMQESLRLAQVNYAVGTQDITNVLLARQRLGLAQEQLARAAAGVQRADIKLARATGTLLKGIP